MQTVLVTKSNDLQENLIVIMIILSFASTSDHISSSQMAQKDINLKGTRSAPFHSHLAIRKISISYDGYFRINSAKSTRENPPALV